MQMYMSRIFIRVRCPRRWRTPLLALTPPSVLTFNAEADGLPRGPVTAHKEVRMKTCMALLAILLLFSLTPLFAQDVDMVDDEGMMLLTIGPAPGDSPPQGSAGAEYGSHPFALFASPLDLSKEQIAKMRALWHRHFTDIHNLRYDLMEKRLEMERLFTDPKTDAKALMAKEKELASIREQLTEQRARTIIEWRSLLTPEQIVKLDLMTMAHHRMVRDLSFEMGRDMMADRMGYGPMGPEGGPGMGPETGPGMGAGAK